MNTCIGIKRERKQRRRGRQRKRPIKSNRFRLAKQHLCTCITLFCTFVCFFAATARLRREKLSFHVLCGTRTQDSDFLFLFQNFDKVFQNSTPEKNRQRGRIERDGISSIKFETVRIHFLKEVFEAVAIDSENCSLQRRLHSFLC